MDLTSHKIIIMLMFMKTVIIPVLFVYMKRVKYQKSRY